MPGCMRTHAFAAVLVLSGAVAAAQSPPPAPASDAAAFELAQAAVTALTLAASVEQSIDRIDRNRLGTPSGRFEATSEARRALGQSQQASAVLGKPIGPANSSVRKVAAAMRAPFNQLSSNLGDAIRTWEKLERTPDENETVDLVRSSAALLGNEGPWDRLAQATIGVTQALLDVSRAAVPGDMQTVRHLQLTKDQRDSLLERLRKAFPRLTATSRGGTPAETAAGILFEFLTRPLLNAEDP
jgi:hypothetical protein